MWSQIYIDYAFHTNFNVGFTSHKNDVHIQLSQWQYWWWFWFAAIWALYFLIILRIYNNKIESYNLTINTSLRSHGKWGDFLIAIIPLSWCGNILINSNFILRMLEWQNESSLFVIRIQGKQWYWAYKYNSDTDFRLKNVFINVGHNNWSPMCINHKTFFTSNTGLKSFIYDYEFKKIHKQKLNNIKLNLKQKNKLSLNSNSVGKKKTLSITNYDLEIKRLKRLSDRNLGGKISRSNFTKSNYLLDDNYRNYSVRFNKFYSTNALSSKSLNYLTDFNTYTKFITKSKLRNLPTNVSVFFNQQNISTFEYDKLEDTFTSSENYRIKNSKFNVKLIKGVINKKNITTITNNTLNTKPILFNYSVNYSDVSNKQSHVEQFWGFRQKRYKKLRPHSFLKNTKYSNTTYTALNKFVEKSTLNKYNLYISIKNNKYKNELIPVTLARRLLRTKRTLVLPVHINITLITNSYDVVHSWFVPGLGLKMDCVPGRSTHHSLYIDNVGFYYGQCAEICGRYHHHMPIRVCALSFDHFLLWWQIKGLPRMYRSEYFKKNKTLLYN